MTDGMAALKVIEQALRRAKAIEDAADALFNAQVQQDADGIRQSRHAYLMAKGE